MCIREQISGLEKFRRKEKKKRSNTRADMFRHFYTLYDCKLSCVSWLLKSALDLGQQQQQKKRA
jgi:hypothetical protein